MNYCPLNTELRLCIVEVQFTKQQCPIIIAGACLLINDLRMKFEFVHSFNPRVISKKKQFKMLFSVIGPRTHSSFNDMIFRDEQ